MSSLISVNCPVCRRPYVLRVNLEHLRENRPKALCARCGQRFDLYEMVEKAKEQASSRPEHALSSAHTTLTGLPKKTPTISEPTPPPTRVTTRSTQPGEYRATVDREAVRRARLRTRTRDEIRRALALPEVQALREAQARKTLPGFAALEAEEAPPSPTVAKQVVTDVDQPFPWLETADPGLAPLTSEGSELSALLKALLTPGGGGEAQSEESPDD